MKRNIDFHRIAVACFLMASALGTGTAHATGGSKVGDGGLAVACSSGSVQLLDLYEAHHERGFVFEWAPFESSVEESIANLKFKASLVLPADHHFLRLFDRASLLNIVKVLDDSLPRTMDAGITLALPPDCELRQVGFWQSTSNTLLIERDYWHRSSNRDRALLLVHEALHEWLAPDARIEATSTVRIRRIVALLALPELEFISRKHELSTLIER